MVELSQILWDSLLELDDLSASTTCIMDLLCTLLSHNRSLFSTHHHQQQHQQQQPHLGGASQPAPTLLTTLVPRLWPFLSHTITSVRLSCLNALLTLLHTGKYNVMFCVDTMIKKKGLQQVCKIGVNDGDQNCSISTQCLLNYTNMYIAN